MGNIIIDKELCTNCKTCSKVCPVGIINAKSNMDFATLNTDMETMCLKCGHCEAHCPSDAIKIEYEGAKSYKGPNISEKITPEQIGHHMTNRRSVRHYKNDPVKKEILENLMELVRYAPTGGNAQQIKWIMMYDRKKIDEVLDIGIRWAKKQINEFPDNPVFQILETAVNLWDSGVDMICRGAPHVAIAYAPDQGLSNPVDAAIATTYLELSAPSYGIGTCWAGFLHIMAMQSQEVKDKLGLPEGNSVYGALMLGYPVFKTYRAPKRNVSNVKWV